MRKPGSKERLRQFLLLLLVTFSINAWSSPAITQVLAGLPKISENSDNIFSPLPADTVWHSINLSPSEIEDFLNNLEPWQSAFSKISSLSFYLLDKKFLVFYPTSKNFKSGKTKKGEK